MEILLDWNVTTMKITIISLLVAGCFTIPFEPEAPYVRITPPPEYSQWYHEAEDCRGMRGNFEVVQFYRVEANDTHTELGREGWIGVWTTPHKIYLLEGVGKDAIVHEMLHDIISYRYGASKYNLEHRDSLAFEVCDNV